MVFDDLTFRLQMADTTLEADGDHFDFFKSKDLVDQFDAFFARHSGFVARNIFELGISEGGSMVFWFHCFAPRTHVGIDHQPAKHQPCLQKFLSRPGVGRRFKPHWNVDQQDSTLLRRIWNTEFQGTPLDLVIDDASHLYGPTKASFEALFPLLRPGGFYLIENWAWDHWTGFQDSDHPWAAERALTDFILELIEAAGTGTDIIRAVHSFQGFTVVERGARALDFSDPIRIEDYTQRRRKSALAREEAYESVEDDGLGSTARIHRSSLAASKVTVPPSVTPEMDVSESRPNEMVIESALTRASTAIDAGHSVLARLLLDEVIEHEPDNAQANTLMDRLEAVTR